AYEGLLKSNRKVEGIAQVSDDQLFDGAIDFSKIRTEDFLPLAQKAFEIAKEEIEQIENNPEEPTFYNTVEAMDLCCDGIKQIMQLYHIYSSVYSSDGLQQIGAQMSNIWSNYRARFLFSKKLYERIDRVWQRRNELNLNREQFRLLEKTREIMIASGVQLPQDQQDQLRVLMSRNQELSLKFAENVRKSETHTQFEIINPDDLKGLPSDAIAYAKQRAVEAGRPDSWIFSVRDRILSVWLTYGENRYWREQLWKGRRMVGSIPPWDNTPIVLELVRIRAQIARLLGLSHYAELVLRDRMLRSSDMVNDLLMTVHQRVRGKVNEEFMELESFANREYGLSDELREWDVSFYGHKLRERKFHVSEEQLRPYFELHATVKRVLEMLGSWFQIQFIPRDDLPVYHPDVRVYEVRDERSKEYLGLLYLDLIYRPNKRSGARMAVVRLPGKTKNGDQKRPHVVVVDNIMPPAKERPSLLSIGNVKTLFHELGHALHALFSKVTYQSLSSSYVSWDFVEFPSQLLENWMDQKEVLLQLGRHYQDGSRIPEELVDRWLASLKFNRAFSVIGLLSRSDLDMAFHTMSPEEAMALEKIEPFEIAVMQKYRLFRTEYFGSVSKSFSHVFSGAYAAGVYSYLWSNVLEADAFEFFEENGIYNQAVFDRLRERVLAKGASENAMDLYRDFRGRAPQLEAFIRRLGVE
ncbi:MAG: M3 family metallopeptidase, partial [Bdellovibrionaceae bacterium]|nr:M3 family metallopeptidase [Pseudobdellovibrionaceae bacterium]